MKKEIIIALIFAFVSVIASAGTKKDCVEIEGCITEMVNGKAIPVPYATVSVKGSTESTFADASGNFVIDVQKGKHNIQISCFGYETSLTKVKAKGKNNQVLSVSLEIKDQTLVQK